MANSDFKIKGVEKLNEFLKTLAPRVQRNISRGMVRAAAKPILQAAKQNAPVGEPSETGRKKYKLYAGALRDSIRVSARIDNRSGQVIASIKAGGKVKRTGADVFYAHMSEFGTKPHALSKSGEINHPGTSPRPFMRPAIDSQAQAAVLAAAEYVRKRLSTKHGLDTADINIEVEEI